MTALDTKELVPLAILLLGFIPIVLSAWRGKTRKWTTAAYTALLIGGIATNVENFAFYTLFNYIEHGVGVGLAGWLFAATAYINQQQTRRIRDEVAGRV